MRKAICILLWTACALYGVYTAVKVYEWYVMTHPKLTQVVFDRDARKYFAAVNQAGVRLSAEQSNAVGDLVLLLKRDKLWSKFDVIYPLPIYVTSNSLSWDLVGFTVREAK